MIDSKSVAVTALFCVAYLLGAYFLIESTDSISFPPEDGDRVVISDIPEVTEEPLLSSKIPANLNPVVSFATGPFVTI